MTPGELEQAWQSLRGAAVELGEFRVLETDVASKAGPALVALDAGGNRHLLVPVRTRPVEDRASRGVQLVRRELLDGTRTRVFLDVICREPETGDFFAVLVSEMVVGIAASPADPGRACRHVLDRWREFLDRDRPPRMGPERLAGLLAELWYLRHLARLDPVRALDCWVAPRGDRHDFRSGPHALEVKATRAREGRVVEVHGVGQLEPPAGGSLHLAVVELDQVDAGGMSVPVLISSIRELGVERRRLLEGLQASGYDPRDEESYRSIAFVVRQTRIYAVDGAFPRIIPASFAGGQLPPGVLRLRYQVDLTGEPPVPLPQSGEEAVLSALIA